MKAKHILTAIALPALLAACSQDMELSDAMNQKDFSNIPTVDVEFGAAIDANTKMATKFGWEVGDKIGLAWLGDGKIITSNGNANYGKAYQNIPLFCTNASTAAFKSETLLYIGEYFAYMPYTEGKMEVENIAFTTAGQKLTTNKGDLAKNAIYISPKKVNLSNEDEIPAGSYAAGMGKNIPLSLSRLSNAVTLDLTFKNTASLADLKIMGVSIDVQKQVTVGNVMTPISLLPVSFKYNPQDNADVAEWSNLSPDAVKTFLGASGGSLSEAAKTGVVSVTSETGLTLSADGKLKTYALILPVGEAMTTVAGTEYELVITVNTNYGAIVADKVKVGGEAWNTTSELFTKFGQSGTITASVDAEKMTFPAKEVKTLAELNSVLAAAATAGAEDEPIVVTLNPAETIADGGAFELKDFTMPEGLKTDVELIAGLNANNKLNFTGTSTINKKLKLTADNGVTVSGTLNVKNIVDNLGAQLTALETTNITVAAGGVLNNEGTIEATKVETKGATKTPAKAAGLYVSAGRNAKFGAAVDIIDGGEIKWVAGDITTNVNELKETELEEGNPVVFAEAINFKNMIDAGNAGVTTIRFYGELTFGNEGTAVNVTGVKNIEVFGKVTMNINESTVTGKQTVDLAALTSLAIKENGSLSIISDNAENELSAANTCATTLAKNSALTIKKLKLTNFESVTYAGKVTLENVSGVFNTQQKVPGSDGSMSITQ